MSTPPLTDMPCVLDRHRFEEFAEIKRIFDACGVITLKGFFQEDPLFHRYLNDLKWCAYELLRMHGAPPPPEATLESVVSRLFASNPKGPIPIYHLGTQPIKLVSGNLLKYGERLLGLAQALLGPKAVLGSPAASDSLIGFPPGEKFENYVLPIHEDFPYLLQSSRQVSFWLSLSPNVPGVGGLDVWPGSQRFGPYPAKVTVDGHYEAIVSPERLAEFARVSVPWDFADLVIMSAHLLHRGCPNKTKDRTRIIQLFRFTDLNDPRAEKYFWQSKTYPRPGADIAEVFQHYASAAQDQPVENNP